MTGILIMDLSDFFSNDTPSDDRIQAKSIFDLGTPPSYDYYQMKIDCIDHPTVLDILLELCKQLYDRDLRSGGYSKKALLQMLFAYDWDKPTLYITLRNTEKCYEIADLVDVFEQAYTRDRGISVFLKL